MIRTYLPPAMIFAILAVDKPTELAAAIATIYPPTDVFPVAPGQWLVADKGTAKDISDKLKITEGENGGALVVAVSGYFGRKATNLWEWMKVKMEQAPNG